ncbi:hypothetical protein [Bosea sp. ANAM02]|uniref:hypothetical protein n=1 Tax=Bosea sp. ANAM02 TaxID=2020412 RepID=UPI00140EE530|nr:hypothetical protein [Bosea sp. ANAM02]BCB22029.1 hypothetical protein OCUBac02_49230 [Bosea sp. ANAM02]
MLAMLGRLVFSVLVVAGLITGVVLFSLPREQMTPASLSPENAFLKSIRTALAERGQSRDVYIDLTEKVRPHFEGKSFDSTIEDIRAVAAATSEISSVPLNPDGIANLLRSGQEVALGFNRSQIRALAGTAESLASEDRMLIRLRGSSSTHTRVEFASLLDTRVYP